MSNESGKTLEPCPFCGGPPEMFACSEPGNDGGYVIGCRNCEACTRVHFGEYEKPLREAWNRRDAALTQQLAQLQAQNTALLAREKLLERALEAAETEFIYLANRTGKFDYQERCRFSALAVSTRAALRPSADEGPQNITPTRNHGNKLP